MLLCFCAVAIYFMPMNLSHRVNGVEKAIDNLYSDTQQTQLKDGINIMTLQSISNQIMRLAGEEKNKTQTKLEIALEKYRNTQKIETLVEDSKNINNLTKGPIIFKENVTEDQWNEWMPLNEWSQTDTFNQDLSVIAEKMQNEWDQISTVRMNLDRLPEEIGKDNETMYQTMLKLNEVQSNIQKISHQPQYKQLRHEYQNYQNIYLAQLLKAQKEGQKIGFGLKELVLKNTEMCERVYKEDLDLRPKVSITFDDGPNEVYTPQVLDILDKHKVKATFFMIGHNVSIVPHMAKEVHDRGHTIGNHTYNHPSLAALEDEEILNEIQMTQDVINSAVGITPDMYRMPYGDGGERVVNLIDDMVSIMWNADSNDWYLKSAEEIYAFLEPSFQRDDIIILMHDIHPQTIEVLDDVLTTLSKKHYKFVRPDQLDFTQRYRPE